MESHESHGPRNGGGGHAVSEPRRAYAASKGKIVAFIILSTNPYIGQWPKDAEAENKELGYDVSNKIIEDNFNQTEEDSRVQQELTYQEKRRPAISWSPMQNAAGIKFA